MKQGVSTINGTRLWRKPGQANRFGDECAGNGTVSVDGVDTRSTIATNVGFGSRSWPEVQQPNRISVWRHGRMVSLHKDLCRIGCSPGIILQPICEGVIYELRKLSGILKKYLAILAHKNSQKFYHFFKLKIFYLIYQLFYLISRESNKFYE